jgi:hypothetical protein
MNTTALARPSRIGSMRGYLLDLLAEHESDGALPTSSRFCFYELIARGLLSKERTGARRADQIVHDALTDLREQGLVPWDWIADETRSVEDYTGYASVLEGVRSALIYVRLDPWRGGAPFILTESRSLAGVLRGIASDYRVRIAATNGQAGGFLHTDVAPRLGPGDVVGYLGDFDLCGGQIEGNTRGVLEQIIGGELDWTRIALTAQQVEEHALPRIRKHDRRYRDGGGEHWAVETEALSQTVLTAMLRDWLDDRLPEPLEDVQEREERERRDIERRLRRPSRGGGDG